MTDGADEPGNGGPSAGMARADALDVVEGIIEAVETETMPVPVRELWVYGDVALGLDPVERLDVYLTKDVLMGATADPDRSDEFEDSLGVEGIGRTVRAEWAEQYPEYVRVNDNGHAAPEKCLAAHLLPDDRPVHLEVCNTGFENNVTQRLKGAMARDAYHEILDPRGVCLWVDAPAGETAGGVTAKGDTAGGDTAGGEPAGPSGTRGRRSEQALAKLRNAELPFPKLSAALEMLGVDEETAVVAARAVHDYRSEQEGATVRGDVV